MADLLRGGRVYPVHPVAALFPMMTENELADLADDIKANGLNFPIVLDTEGKTLIDGRNRLKACEIASVEPKFDHLNGQDPAGYIISANISRRHLTVGQIAMALALTEREKAAKEAAEAAAEAASGISGGTAQKSKGRGRPRGGHRELARIAGIDRKRIDEAAVVAEFAPEMVEEVMTNKTRLDAAYKAAELRKKAKEWRTQGMDKLRRAAPKYAERVDNGELTFEEARTLLSNDEKAEEQVRQTTYQMLAEFSRLADGIAHTPRVQEVPEWIKTEEYEEAFRQYFKGGIKELQDASKNYQRAVDIINAMIAQFPKPKRGRAA
jgi:hypothetical protein